MSRQLWITTLAAFLVSSMGCKPPATIKVVQATYGGNCQAEPGNVTTHLASACDGKQTCDYTIDVTVLGDPRIGCAKTFEANWRCPGEEGMRRVTVPAEAGLGAVINLVCGS